MEASRMHSDGGNSMLSYGFRHTLLVSALNQIPSTNYKVSNELVITCMMHPTFVKPPRCTSLGKETSSVQPNKGPMVSTALQLQIAVAWST